MYYELLVKLTFHNPCGVANNFINIQATPLILHSHCDFTYGINNTMTKFCV